LDLNVLCNQCIPLTGALPNDVYMLLS